MDPYLCCLLGICCPPFSPEQLATMTKILMDRGIHTTREAAEAHARFDIQMFKDAKDTIWKMAKKDKA